MQVTSYTSRSPRAARALSLPLTLAMLAVLTSAASANSTVTFTLARATGTILQNTPGGPVSVPFEKELTGTFNLGTPFPQDTIPSQVFFEFAWHAEPVPPATRITGYEYEFAETRVSVGPNVESVNFGLFGTGALVGAHYFVVRAFDDAQGVSYATRWFQMNFAPDSWFSGPDPASISVVPGSGGQRYLNVGNWSALGAVPKSLLSCDSLTQLPSQRPEHRTFFEIYQNRLYLRAEGDTVNRGSWLVFHSGGFDVDSPYAVHVAPGATIPGSLPCSSLGPLSVIAPAGVNGSPVGFRLRVPVAFDPDGASVSQPSETTTYPVFDPASVIHQPAIAGYWSVTSSGRAYATARAADGEGSVDRRVDKAGGAKAIVDHVEQGTATPEELALRPKILTFLMNRAPVLEFGSPGFFPRPPQYGAGQIAGSPDRTLRLRYFANDPDPFDPYLFQPGGPSGPQILRYTTTVLGTKDDHTQASYTAPVIVAGTSASQDIHLAVVAPEITSSDVTVRIQLCDCVNCDDADQAGRCVTYDVPVHLEAPLPAPQPDAPALALAGFQPNPSAGDGVIWFALPDDRPATLELIDMSGRRVWSTRTSPGAGRHAVRVERSLAPGVYVVKLSHGGEVRLVRAALLR